LAGKLQWLKFAGEAPIRGLAGEQPKPRAREAHSLMKIILQRVHRTIGIDLIFASVAVIVTILIVVRG
jgi:hypothetical protein